MKAREKLNKLHLSGDVVLAGVAGIVAGSWLVFFVAVAVLVGLDVHTGQIRPRRNANLIVSPNIVRNGGEHEER